MKNQITLLYLILFTAIIFAQEKKFEGQRYKEPSNANPNEVYFGDPHIHTRISVDAALWGNTLGPADTYRFVRGEEVTSFKGWKVKIGRPLDWTIISDHSDFYGFYQRMAAGDSYVTDEPLGAHYYDLMQKGETRQVTDEFVKAFGDGELPWDPSLEDALRPGWKETVEAAEAANDPGDFTAFIAYEWTSNPGGDNLHRVVLYRDNADKTKNVLPYTTSGSNGSPDPEDLWTALEAYEKNSNGGQVMAIPHNGNWSSGIMFDNVTYTTKKPFDKNYVERRNRWEPLYENTQIKGDGEAHPILSPDDEFADYETWDVGNLSFSRAVTIEMLEGSYSRSGLKRGLKYQEKFGTNPFQFGLVGAGDSHTSLPGQEENNYWGKHASSEPDAERWKTPFRQNEKGLQEGWTEVASGLTGVWATENTRTALFDAMKRKEVYATTGTRMKVRVFGGWYFNEGDDKRSDYVNLGYEKGVPMGGIIHARSNEINRGLALKLAHETQGPTFIVHALMDPMGGTIDRLQMVKGWLDSDGNEQEKVYDIAWSDNRIPDPKTGKIPPVGNTVNIADATWTNTIGDTQMSTVWQDPDFDSKQQAFYYVRAIEIPIPRWTCYDQKRFGIKMSPEVPMTTQERVYTSPIWYIP